VEKESQELQLFAIVSGTVKHSGSGSGSDPDPVPELDLDLDTTYNVIQKVKKSINRGQVSGQQCCF
jgi:hypothetical protein